MEPSLLRGDPVATVVRDRVRERVDRLRDRGVVPTLGTVLMSDAADDRRFVELKHAACADVGIAIRDVRLDPAARPERLYRAIGELCSASAVDGVFVQVPLPDHVSLARVRRRLDPRKDVDCFHPENLGRLVVGDPRFVPATTAAVSRLLTHYDVPVAGADVVVVGRSNVIGKPLANLLVQDAEGGNATVTVCHSRTADLASVTRRADVLVTASGTPELIDGSMLSPGVVVVDVSATRRPDSAAARGPASTAGSDVVGDVDIESATSKAAAITPVPGGVGPVTLAMLVRNTVEATKRRAAVE